MSAPHRISVMVLHEDPVMGAGLLAVLGTQADLDVFLGETRGGAGPDAAAAAGVDVVVADHRNALACLERAAVASPGQGVCVPKVLVISSLDREADVRSALRAGVRGYVLQGSSIEELFNGVRWLARGSRYLCDTVAGRIADSLTREDLTGREAEVLQLLTRGMANKVIARELGIAVGTVKTHVKGILEKLDARTRTHAVAIATERGLVRGPARPAPRNAKALNGAAVGAEDWHSYA